MEGRGCNTFSHTIIQGIPWLIGKIDSAINNALFKPRIPASSTELRTGIGNIRVLWLRFFWFVVKWMAPTGAVVSARYFVDKDTHASIT